jgi:signal transduction histidine kinase
MNVLHNSEFPARNPGCDLKVYTVEASYDIHSKYQELSDFLLEKDNYKFFDLEEYTPHDTIQKYNYIKNLQLGVPVTIYRYYQGNYLGTINYIWKIPLRDDHRSETENARVIAKINEELPKYYTRQMRKNALKKVSFLSQLFNL